MTLTASDKDEGPNREVIYTVVGVQSLTPLLDQPQNLFDIDRSTGVVFVNASLIGYPGEHNVTFMAVDSAAEPKNVTTSVTVFVQDVNINEPVFIVPDQALVNTAANILPNITVDEVGVTECYSLTLHHKFQCRMQVKTAQNRNTHLSVKEHTNCTQYLTAMQH